jgi:hypothetical protein
LADSAPSERVIARGLLAGGNGGWSDECLRADRRSDGRVRARAGGALALAAAVVLTVAGSFTGF